MTLNAIEIWNLNSFKGTHKYKNIKNQKQKNRESFLRVELMEESKMDSQSYFSEMQNGYLFRQMQQEKM